MELLKGDCLELLPLIPSNTATVFFCDLPYGCIASKWDIQIDMDKLWEQMLRIGKENCVFAFTCTFKFAVLLYQSNPKLFRQECIWQKRAPSNPMLSTFRHMPKHELLLVFYRKKPNWRRDEYHTRIMEKTLKDINKDDYCFSQLGSGGYGVKFEPTLPTTLLTAAKNFGRHKHPTEKDPSVIAEVLRYWAGPGDTVIDPTMGCGSTGIACKSLGLNFIGIEKDEKYQDLCVERLN